MWPASSHKRRSGRLDLGRDRRRRGLGVGDLRSCCGVIASTDRFRSRSLRLACPRMLGVRSHGVKVQQNGCPRALPAYASVRHIAITGSPRNRPEEWLLVEWPEGEQAPTKYWFSTLSATIGFRELVDIVKLRWRIERDYHELKQEVGLGHFEGRSWRGFHHHATLCIAAYGFLVSEREMIPPSEAAATPLFKEAAIPATYRPRGSAIAA